PGLRPGAGRRSWPVPRRAPTAPAIPPRTTRPPRVLRPPPATRPWPARSQVPARSPGGALHSAVRAGQRGGDGLVVADERLGELLAVALGEGLLDAQLRAGNPLPVLRSVAVPPAHAGEHRGGLGQLAQPPRQRLR